MTKEIYLVTGNANKLEEFRAIFPATADLQVAQIDLDEIQSMDLSAIVADKLDRAYQEVNKPVIVEDVSASLDKLYGLPGPFIKYFEEKLGPAALFLLAGEEESAATIVCTMGYYDGSTKHIVSGEIHGKVVAPRGKNGFGFDVIFVPEGETRTNAEMSPHEKNQISHRALAIKALASRLFPEKS